MTRDKPHIEPRITELRHILVYGHGTDLLYRVRDTAKFKDLSATDIYDELLTMAREALAMRKAEGMIVQEDATFNPVKWYIVERQAVIVGMLFYVKHGELEEPPADIRYDTIRGQIGRIWN